MTLKNLIDYAYEYCTDHWLMKECDELSNLTATWTYQEFKDKSLKHFINDDALLKGGDADAED